MAAELAQHEGSRDRALFDRSGQPQDIIPMATDKPDIDGSADQAAEGWILLRVTVDIKPFLRQIADTRGETEAQEVHEREHMVAETGCVGIVFRNPQIRFMVEQTVENISGIADRCIDDLRVEGRVLVGNVRIEKDAGFIAVSGVHSSGGLAPATGAEALPVRG